MPVLENTNYRKAWNVLKPDLERYTLLVQQIKNKTKERKTLLAEKKATPFYQFVAHNDLAKQIAELAEDLEELKSEKTMLLSSFDCSEDTGIAEVKKSVAAMEENLKRLAKHEEDLLPSWKMPLKQFSELREPGKKCEAHSMELAERADRLTGEKIQSATSRSKRHMEKNVIRLSCLTANVMFLNYWKKKQRYNLFVSIYRKNRSRLLSVKKLQRNTSRNGKIRMR